MPALTQRQKIVRAIIRVRKVEEILHELYFAVCELPECDESAQMRSLIGQMDQLRDTLHERLQEERVR